MRFLSVCPILNIRCNRRTFFKLFTFLSRPSSRCSIARKNFALKKLHSIVFYSFVEYQAINSLIEQRIITIGAAWLYQVISSIRTEWSDPDALPIPSSCTIRTEWNDPGVLPRASCSPSRGNMYRIKRPSCPFPTGPKFFCSVRFEKFDKEFFPSLMKMK